MDIWEKNEESGTLAHPGLWGWLRPWGLDKITKTAWLEKGYKLLKGLKRCDKMYNTYVDRVVFLLNLSTGKDPNTYAKSDHSDINAISFHSKFIH